MAKDRTVAELKARQALKLQEIRSALEAAGCKGLDAQAEMLGVPRSTAWTILSGVHKGSGLSAGVAACILRSPNLAPCVRTKVLEYIVEKSSGEYGGSKHRLHKFVSRMVRGRLL